MSIDTAMSYEVLVRRAYDCNRYGVKGADADIYRDFEQTLWFAKDNPKDIKLQNDYNKAFNIVRQYVVDALNQSIKVLQKSAGSQNQIDQIQHLISKAKNATESSHIENIIDESLNLFIEFKIGFRD